MSGSTFTHSDLHLERSGPADSPPVVILHGWGSSAANMKVLAQELEADYRVWNVDLPGHGFSAPPPEPWGVPEHARLIAGLIEEECGGSATLLGHSNGGRISLYMASDDELRPYVDRMILISPSGVPRPRTARYHVKRVTAQVLKAPFEILPDPAREFGLDWLRHSLVWRLLGSSDYRALEGVMRETFVRTVNCYVDDRLHTIQVPVLLFWGTEDEAISREQMQVLEDRIPDAGIVELKGAGHYGYLDDFDTVAAGISHFLSVTDSGVVATQR